MRCRPPCQPSPCQPSPLPAVAFAAGADSDIPPAPTDTTKTCAEGRVWDRAAQICVTPAASTYDDNAIMDPVMDSVADAVRALADAGGFDEARSVPDGIDAADTRVLTYRGFTARKMGDIDAGMRYCRSALDIYPDNLLARS